MSELVKVAVDLDDVVVDFTKGVVDCMNTEFGLGWAVEENCNEWHWYRNHDWRRYGFRDWWDWMRQRDWLWSTFGAVEGAIGGVSGLRARGFYVEALTSKPAWAEPQVWRWLGRWRVPFNQVTIMDGATRTKAEASDATFLIDDRSENCEAWADAGRIALLFTARWNMNLPAPNGSVRALNWEHVLEWFEPPRLERLMKGDL